jgi:hypothetical protein
MQQTTHPSASSLHRGFLTVAALVGIVATVSIGANARGWIGRPFPGFFVLANRVIPSVGLANWSGTRDGAVHQRVVVAIDGVPVASAREVYHRVAAQPPGRAFTYALRHGSTTEMVTLTSHRFSSTDYAAIFAAYLLNGLCYLALGIVGAWLLPETDLGRALLYVGSVAAIFAFSAVGLYGPEAAMRIHTLAEAFLPATLVHLSVVFPRSRGALAQPLTVLAWTLSLALAVPYQLLLTQPSAYSTLHAACELYFGVTAAMLLVTLVLERARSVATPLVRAAVTGGLLGLGVPAVVKTLSAFVDGALPVNVLATTAFLFPAFVVWGLLRERAAIGYLLVWRRSADVLYPRA